MILTACGLTGYAYKNVSYLNCSNIKFGECANMLQHASTCSHWLQHSISCCNVLQHAVTCCCNTL